MGKYHVTVTESQECDTGHITRSQVTVTTCDEVNT